MRETGADGAGGTRRSRRGFLAVAGTAALGATGSLAGCQFLGGSNPAATVEEFYAALDEGRTGAARAEYVGGPAAEHFPPYFGDGFDDYDITVEETEVTAEEGDTATVATTATVGFPVVGKKTVSGDVTVRQQDGSRVWEIPAALPLGTEVEFELPVDRQTAWELTWYNERISDELEIARRSGDQDRPLDASQLLVHIDGARSSWANGHHRWTDLGGDASVVVGECRVDRASLESTGATPDGPLALNGASVVLTYIVPETNRPFEVQEWESVLEHEFDPP